MNSNTSFLGNKCERIYFFCCLWGRAWGALPRLRAPVPYGCGSKGEVETLGGLCFLPLCLLGSLRSVTGSCWWAVWGYLFWSLSP